MAFFRKKSPTEKTDRCETCRFFAGRPGGRPLREHFQALPFLIICQSAMAFVTMVVTSNMAAT